MSHPIASWLQQLRSVFAKETLPPPPADAGPARPEHHGFTHLFFDLEPLPHDPPRPRRGRKRSLLALLLAPERLPLDPERPARHRARWLHRLFRPERIDDDQDSPEVH